MQIIAGATAPFLRLNLLIIDMDCKGLGGFYLFEFAAMQLMWLIPSNLGNKISFPDTLWTAYVIHISENVTLAANIPSIYSLITGR